MKKLLTTLCVLALALVCVLVLPTRTEAASVEDLDFSFNAQLQNYAVSLCDSAATGELEIPATYNGYPVTSIEGSAFSHCSGLTSVIIPDSVHSIGGHAFYNCSGLTGVTIGNGVTSIGQNAFLNCTTLTHVCYAGTEEQWNTVSVLEGNDVLVNATICFLADYTYNIVDGEATITGYTGSGGVITIPSTLGGCPVTSIGDSAFHSCNNLTGIVIPYGVKSIGDFAFYSCRSLTNIGIPDSVTHIGCYTFEWCSGLTTITIPDSVTAIGDSVFRDCGSLTSIKIPDSVTSVGNHAFEGCSNLTDIVIPCGVTSIGEWAFSHCYGLTRIKVPNSVTSISSYAFAYCSELTRITIPDSVSAIPDHAFFGCTKLQSIVIPVNVIYIRADAFKNCRSLFDVYYTGKQLQWNRIDIEEGNEYITSSFEGATIHYNVKLATITKQPVSVITGSGNVAKVSVAATGDGLTHTWYHKSAKATKYSKSSVTGSTYSVKMSDTVNGRYVYCVITDQYGNSVRSNVVRVYMGKSAIITTQPKSVKVAPGQTAKVTVKATGDGLKYTWYHKSANATKYSKSSVTSATYSVKMSSSVHGRYVYCVITDQYGNSVKTSVVRVYQGNPAKVTTQPKSVKVAPGKTAKVTVKATGDGLKYTWYHKSAKATKYSKSSVTGATYAVKMSSSVHGRYVYCVITDQYGNSIKTSVVRVYQGKIVKITTQPVNVAVKNGKTAKVTVKATGDGLKYVWYYAKKGSSKFTKTTVTSASYSVKMSSSVSGRKVYCVITDQYGNSVKTNTVTLYMGNPAKITTQPKSVTVKAGKTAKVTVKASGDGLTYTWYYAQKGAAKWSKSGITKNVFSVKMAAKWNGCRVYCVVKDKYGTTVKTNVVTLKMK